MRRLEIEGAVRVVACAERRPPGHRLAGLEDTRQDLRDHRGVDERVNHPDSLANDESTVDEVLIQAGRLENPRRGLAVRAVEVAFERSDDSGQRTGGEET